MALTEVLAVLYQFFDFPLAVLFIIPLFVFLYFFLSEDFIASKFQSKGFVAHRKKFRRWLLLSRCLVFFFLLLALAQPFVYDTHVIQGDPRVHVLVDQSDSFGMFDVGAADELIDRLESRVRVEQSTMGFGTVSDLGDSILSNLHQHDNLLLVTDGHATSGASLDDVTLYAQSLNATISVLQVDALTYDAAVRVVGPSKTTADVENTFYVSVDETIVTGTGVPSVSLDGVAVPLERTGERSWKFSSTFSSGYHRIEAAIAAEDAYVSNNYFYKSVKVVPKPKVALYSIKSSPLVELFSPIYDLVELESLDANLDPYTALIINDVPAAVVDGSLSNIIDFTADGNGLVVFGGQQSYDFTDYKGSQFEQVLPVYVAQAGRKPGDVNVVVVMDISGSTGSLVAGDKAVDVEKAITLGVLQDISLMHRVGVVAFNTQSFTVADMKLLIEQVDLVDNVAALQDLGGTRIDVGLARGLEMLQGVSGDKNIILISDGKTQGYEDSLRAAVACADAGVRVYTIGVGSRTNDELMAQIAEVGNGAFISAAEKERIKLLFGDPDEDASGSIHLTLLDDNHFITQDLEDVQTPLYGFNTVVPKTAAKLLVTTNLGDPLLTVWRFGLGRVASFTTDDGSAYAPGVLNRQNSRLLTRMLNWGIGDPERKNSHYIDVADAFEGDTITATVKSAVQPTATGVSFVKVDEHVYQGMLVAAGAGFHGLGGATYAVNGPQEFYRVGFNDDLVRMAESTGGKVFAPSDADGIEAFIRSSSRKSVHEKISYAWPFLVLAILVYLIEIFFRRVIRHRLR